MCAGQSVYTGGVAKRLKTYRVDGDLDDAVAAKAASLGETVTDVIIRALREYVTEPRPRTGHVAVAGSPPTMPPEPPLPRRKSASRNCSHVNMRLRKGFCPDCEEWAVKI